jgi:hypothetical protein
MRMLIYGGSHFHVIAKYVWQPVLLLISLEIATKRPSSSSYDSSVVPITIHFSIGKAVRGQQLSGLTQPSIETQTPVDVNTRTTTSHIQGRLIVRQPSSLPIFCAFSGESGLHVKIGQTHGHA